MTARSPFEPRQVVSRRGGRMKEPLSRDAIVNKALELLTRDGLEGMSLRKVAKALDTGPASLYVYVQDLRELEALVLDRALAQVKPKGAHQKAWRARLHAVLGSYLLVLFRNPGLGQLAMRTIAAGPNGLGLLDALLGILQQAGIDDATAAWAVDLLLAYTTAIGVEQSQRAGNSEAMDPIARALGAASPAQYAHVHRVRDELLSGGRTRFTWALDVLIEGIVRRPRAKTARPAPARKRRPRSK